MARRRKNEPSYGTTLVKAAPFFAAKSLIGDLPKGAIEKSIELKVTKGTPWKKGWSKGFRGQGMGRAMGAMSGIVTAPLYLKSLSLLKSNNKSDRKKGLALLTGVTGAYTMQKGLGESYKDLRVGGVAKRTAFKKGLQFGAGRLTYKIPAAILLAHGLTKGTKKKGKKNSGLGYAAAAGAGAGTLNRIGDTLIKEFRDKPRRSRFRKGFGRRALGGGLGGMAAGALGGVVLSKAISGAMKSLEKK